MPGNFSYYPYIDKDAVTALGECGVVEFLEFDRETIRRI